jgi:hypothetical protein
MAREPSEEGRHVNAERKRSRGARAAFLGVAVVLIYIVLSIAIAINTVDKCGDESDPKHWSFSPMDESWQLLPPEWICEDDTPEF